MRFEPTNVMGWPPAVIIVVRHGARLDAADKQWHLTSPTPYDPPLTYGGWNQSRALGARIANILRTRETDDEVPFANGREAHNGEDRRKRRHKVIIHSSPFLRCVQTSVAISAGLAQNPGHTHRPSSAPPKTSQMRFSPNVRPVIIVGSPKLDPIQEPAGAAQVNGKVQEQQENIKKSTIRVDAFLGEWLSPDYFELITPPPSSIMMVGGAKADLLRREDYTNLAHVRDKPYVNQGFPGGWGSPIFLPEKDKEKDDGPLCSLSSLAQALPRRDRTSSLGSMGSAGSRHSSTTSAAHAAEHGIYQPPVPTYAISYSDPIPPGHVAHARDACVDVDYQWDSMREPQNWGNGGEYGEEWSSMHKRFRKGLQQMISWYKTSDDPGKLMAKNPTAPSHNLLDVGDGDGDEDGDDTDLVIILVTHGAGCNALIGALTNQPVLLDVGMASLTMAVRKPSPVNTPTSTPGHSRASSRNLTISSQYDVKLVANTEHLRSSATSTPSSSRTSSAAGMARFREPYSNSGLDGGPIGKSGRSFTVSGSLGSIRRTTSITNTGTRSYVPSRQSSIGLWSAPAARAEEPEEAGDDMILNFGDDGTAGSLSVASQREEEAVTEIDDDEEDDVAPLGGLWGTPRPPGHAEQIREIGQKRRWTVHERAL